MAARRRGRGAGATGPGTSPAGRPRSSRRASREELAAAVGAAAAAGRKVKVAGSGHSFTEAALTEGTMIRIEALRGVIDADPGSGLVKVGAGTRPRRPQRGAGGARAGDGEPRRHRPPDPGRGDLDRDPRHRRAAAQHLRPGRGDRAGPRRRQRSPPHRRDRPGAAAGGAGRGRGAGGDRGRDPALRPRLHPAPGRPARAARGGPRLLRASWPTPTTTSSSSPSPTPTTRSCSSATAARSAPRPRGRGRRLPQRRGAGELGAGGARGDRQGAAAGDPGALAAGRAARLRQPHRDRSDRVFVNERRVRFTEMEYGLPREHGPEAARRVIEWVRSQPLPGLLPDRDAGRRRRRRLAQPLPRARHRLHRRPPVPGDGVAPLLRGGRGDHGRTTAAAPTGASATSRPPRPWRPATPPGPSSRRPATSSTPAASSATSTRERVLGP